VLGDANPRARLDQVLHEVFTHKTVRIKELAQKLGVHEMTVRRDLDALTEQGMIERFHGGARLLERASDDVAYSFRVQENAEGKIRMATAALELIQDGDTVALDASTSTLALAQILSARQVGTIITSLDAANALSSANLPFTLIGGTFHARARSFVGALATATLKKLHPDKVFFSSKGFTPATGFTDAHLPETEMKERLIAVGGVNIALLDHTKFGRVALNTVAEMQEVDIVITDAEPAPNVRAALETADVRLIVADT
jgi:DeoR family transcriptional regulator, fructose operon transcriptional repressor